MEESGPFKLNNSSDSFTAKSADIFGCLSALEKKHEAHQASQPEDTTESVLKPDPEDEDTGRPQRTWRGRDESRSDRREFARPYPPSRNRGNHGGHDYRGNRGYRGRNRNPDFKVNPDRWTKYSLEDVEGKDMTESSNTKAAFAFLDERRKMREMEDDPEAFVSANVEDTACSKGAITFVRKKKEKTETVQKKDAVVDVFAGEEGEGLDEEGKKEPTEEKVSFKSKKGKKRNIRIRHSDDEDEQNG